METMSSQKFYSGKFTCIKDKLMGFDYIVIIDWTSKLSAYFALQILNEKRFMEKLIAFEKNTKGTLSKLSTTSSGTSLQAYSNFRVRSGSVPSSAKKSNKLSLKKLAIRHGAAELSSNIVRYYDDSHSAITSLNKEVKKCNSILE